MHPLRYVALAVVVALLSSIFCSPLQSADVVAEQGRDPLSSLPPASQKTVGWLGNGSNWYPEATPATEWSPEKHILWSVSVGSSFSSGIVIADKILITSEPSLLVCVDATEGKILWKKNNVFSDLPEKVEEIPVPGDEGGAGNAAATPASDGQFVYACFGYGIVACYDLQGQRKWITCLKGTPPGYGRSASPVLVGDKVLVSIGNLTALDTKTGKEVWKAEDVKEVYGTPAKANIGGVDVVIMPAGDIVRVADGSILASTDRMAKFASPIVHDGVVYFMDTCLSALQLPDKVAGKLQVKQLWEASLEGEVYASPVYANGLLFTVNDQGTLYIVDGKDGKVLVTKELPFESQGVLIYSSPPAAGGYIFINNLAGETLVIEATREYKEVASNRLAEGSGGTPVFDGKRMFERGGERLYCIGEK
jgi:outer membrane protein assembly factor BamB